jgi:hypothetical protein
LNPPLATPPLWLFFQPDAFSPAAQHSHLEAGGPVITAAQKSVMQLKELFAANRVEPLKQEDQAVEHLLLE